MIHGLTNDYLYAAKKVVAKWRKGSNCITVQGTGFFVNRNDEFLFLVTNRHVVEPGYSDSRYQGYFLEGLSVEVFQSSDNDGLPCNIVTAPILNLEDFRFANNVHDDIACIKNIEFQSNILINSWIGYDMLATLDWIKSKLTVCDTIAYPGFPKWFDHRNNVPIFRMGTVASDPRIDYCADLSMPHASRVAYEGFSSGGASGSPVFAIQKGFQIGDGLSAPQNFYREVKLVGINAGHFSSSEGHSGISYFYKSSAIRDVIDSA